MSEKLNIGSHVSSDMSIYFKAMQEAYRGFVLAIKESNKNRPPLLRQMANNGWYLSPEFPIPAIGKIANALTTNKSDVEMELCDYYDNRICDLNEYIKSSFPHRHDLVADAFWAHKEKRYGLSVPILLAQSEGMCIDTFGEKLFSKKDGKMKLANKFSNVVPGSLQYSIILQMTEVFPIAANDCSVDKRHLNRHRVMHGMDFSYGTRTNSCKAISLIDYVSWTCTSTNTHAVPNKTSRK